MKPEEMPTIQIDEDIFELVSSLNSSKKKCDSIDHRMKVVLRKASLIRSVNSSVAIEGNTLKDYEVADIIDGKEVIGPFDEIVEVQNAIKAYDLLPKLQTWSIEDFLQAEDTMMFGLVRQNGFRDGDVGIFEGDKLIYKAPGYKEVGPLIGRLFQWGSETKLPAPVVASIAHFYIEVIHPFNDGNGRMGRLWNTKILMDSDNIYSLIPSETYIRRKQQDYYSVLQNCQSTDSFDCTEFVKFNIGCLIQAFEDLSHVNDDRMQILLDALDNRALSLKDLMSKMGYSSRGTFMESFIKPALDYGLIMQTEQKSNSRYQKYRRVV